LSKPNFNIVLIALYSTENRGIRCLSSLLRAAGFTVKIVFLKRWINNNIQEPTPAEIELLIDLLIRLDARLVGISLGTPYLKIARNLSRIIRLRLKIPVIWGGVHPTISPEDCVEEADYICVGEGEYPLLELAEALAGGGATDNIANIWRSDGRKLYRTSLRPLIADLDALPFPDYEDDNKYLVEDNRIIRGEILKKDAEYRIYPSRGCPFNCAYCNSAAIRKVYRGLGSYYRYRSPDNIIAELKYALRYFPGTRRIKFDGDTFTFPREWIEKFCRLYREEILIPFEILLHPLSAEEENLIQLKEAGLQKVQMGIESGSENESKEIYLREGRNSDVRRFAGIAHRLKIEAVYDIICDNPLAGSRDKEECLEFLLSLPRPFKLYLYSLTVFPETDLAREFLRRGIISESDIEGEATKSFRQFRFSFFYPRPAEETFWASLWALTSKSFIPRPLIRFLSRRPVLKKHPLPLQVLAITADLIRIVFIAFQMLIHGEMTVFKFKQYGGWRSWITQ